MNNISLWYVDHCTELHINSLKCYSIIFFVVFMYLQRTLTSEGDGEVTPEGGFKDPQPSPSGKPGSKEVEMCV